MPATKTAKEGESPHMLKARAAGLTESLNGRRELTRSHRARLVRNLATSDSVKLLAKLVRRACRVALASVSMLARRESSDENPGELRSLPKCR
jgi:hypothetical protein